MNTEPSVLRPLCLVRLGSQIPVLPVLRDEKLSHLGQFLAEQLSQMGQFFRIAGHISAHNLKCWIASALAVIAFLLAVQPISGSASCRLYCFH